MVEVTLICTVYNEGEDIRELLDSVLEQERRPDEFVIVDGGSDDETQQIIEEYEEEHDWIRLIVEEGCNIAEGRNIAVENASHDYIMGTDGGCVLDEDWCKAKAEAFEEGHEALSGLFQPIAENTFEYVQGQLRAAHYTPENVPDNWPPSSRSVGFTREAWKDAGKYPEHLYTGEDAKFNSNIRRAGYEWHVVRDAMVYWRMRPTWKAYWNQFYRYGEGDARAGNMFDYPGKIFGISKVALRTATTWLGLVGLAGTVITPLSLPVSAAGFGAQYIPKLEALKKSVDEKGLKTFPYWLAMVPFTSIAHFTGYYREEMANVF